MKLFFRAEHDMSSDASLVCNIQRALQEHLWDLIKDVEKSEKRIAELEKEVDSLRTQTGPLSNGKCIGALCNG